MWDCVRKFGLQFCDLSTMLANISPMLRVLTLNIDSRHKKSIPIISYIFTIITAACYFYVYFVSMIWFVFWRCRETGDRIAAMIVLSLGISSEMSTCKLLNMFLHKETIKKIVDEYLKHDATIIKGSRFSNNLLKNLKTVKKRAMIFWLVIIVNGVIYVAKPIIQPGRHIMEDIFILLGLEPMFESPNYEISFAMATMGVFYTCYVPANVTSFFIIIIGYTEATMLALSEELLHLWEDAKQFYENNLPNIDVDTDFTLNGHIDYLLNKDQIMNNFIKQRLQNIIMIHTTTLTVTRQIEFAFRDALAVEFSLLTASLIAELLGGLENTYIDVPYALMQVAMDCFVGQRMMDACDVFEKAVYDCKWENFNSANMKTVLMVLKNSQKTLVISAGGVTILSFSCLMNVIKSIYSAYTALRSTMA
ncbi:unnamed protein product [Diatraea saccharalis]|uniref:Odorant receptor n=1 Tax=Diatraea saccharalis TaxID=40085 RepID=A0A9N9R3F0_9NEOP|nr:unnamed protein product [Diatraea saccharalis]